MQGCGPGGCRGCQGPPDFGKSVNPISTRALQGDRLFPPIYYQDPQIFRPSDGTDHECSSSMLKAILKATHADFLRTQQCGLNQLLATYIDSFSLMGHNLFTSEHSRSPFEQYGGQHSLPPPLSYETTWVLLVTNLRNVQYYHKFDPFWTDLIKNKTNILS